MDLLKDFTNTYNNLKNQVQALQNKVQEQTKAVTSINLSLGELDNLGPSISSSFDAQINQAKAFISAMESNYKNYLQASQIFSTALPKLMVFQSNNSFSGEMSDIAEVLQSVILNPLLEELSLSNPNSCLYKAFDSGEISVGAHFGLPSPTLGVKIELQKLSSADCLLNSKDGILKKIEDQWKAKKASGSQFINTIDQAYQIVKDLENALRKVNDTASSIQKDICSTQSATLPNFGSSQQNWLQNIGSSVLNFNNTVFGQTSNFGSLFTNLRNTACNQSPVNLLLQLTTSIVKYFEQSGTTSIPVSAGGLFNGLSTTSNNLNTLLVKSPDQALCNTTGVKEAVCDILSHTNLGTAMCFYKYFKNEQIIFHTGISLSFSSLRFISLDTGYKCTTKECWDCINGYSNPNKKKRGIEASSTSSLGAASGFWVNNLASFSAAKTITPGGNPDDGGDGNGGSGLSTGALVGIIAASVVFGLIIIGLIAFAVVQSRNNPKNDPMRLH